MRLQHILVFAIVVASGITFSIVVVPGCTRHSPPPIEAIINLPAKYEQIEANTTLSFVHVTGMRVATEDIENEGRARCVLRLFQALGGPDNRPNSVTLAIVAGSSSTTLVYSSSLSVEVDAPVDADYVYSTRYSQPDNRLLSRIDIQKRKGQRPSNSGAGQGTSKAPVKASKE